ncbi:MAG: putative secreted protein [Myxococcales bacterium]|nr:putative secreted protein [Myxococcales bacterium]
MEVLVPQLVALQPHVVTLQEVIEKPGAMQQAQLIASALRAEYRFGCVDPESAGGPIGNAIVSRLPIVSDSRLSLPGRERDPRGALRCEITTPCGRVSVVTTHLSWELDAPHIREQQVLVLDEFARAGTGEMPTIMTGDFNCTPDSLVHQFLTGRASLEGRGTYWRDCFQRRHPHSDGFTWSARNPNVVRSVERNRRVDYIFVGPMKDDGPGAIQHARVVLDLPGGDDTFPSDHFGVFAEIALGPVDNGV